MEGRELRKISFDIILSLGFIIFNCKITSCGGEGLLVSGNGLTMYGSVITSNEVGIRVLEDSLPDFGGGFRYSPGGNYIFGNENCDLIFEGMGYCLRDLISGIAKLH